jgi:hypothetical protein
MAIKKVLNRKMRLRYNGLVVVIARNKGGAYIIAKLDGAVFDCPVTAFRVIPYFTCKSLMIPALDRFIDIGIDRLQEMEDSKVPDPDSGPFGDDEGDLLSQVDHDLNEDSSQRFGGVQFGLGNTCVVNEGSGSSSGGFSAERWP